MNTAPFRLAPEQRAGIEARRELALMDPASRRMYLDCCHRVADSRGGTHYYDANGNFLTTEWHTTTA